MKEIGSEFWTANFREEHNNELDFLKTGNDYKLFMSGRTAIDYVINDIDDKKKIVYMPDYCCNSMVQPFIDNDYRIKHYHVDLLNNRYEIDIDCECSIFFAMSYFGYSISNMDKYICQFEKRNITVIEDITHRLLSDNNYCKKSTYLIASLRKWFPIVSGGIAINLNNEFKNNLEDYSVNKEFVELKEKAMNLKRDYILGNREDKEEFLTLFNQSNKMINNYKKMKIDDKSIKVLKKLDMNKIKQQRINNCKAIESKLKNNKNIKLLYNYNEGDCPLFVPITLKNRDKVRKSLINKNVFLPVHWPNENELNNDMYGIELSLVNDQRYSESDIDDYINTLINIVEE